MEFYTLNQIINLLESVCNDHAQISKFEFGEEYDISTEQEAYPLVWADVLPSSISEKTLLVNMEVMVLDIQRTNEDNQKDTLSDTLSIAQDIYAAMSNPLYQDYFFIQKNVQLDPVREGLPDIVNGWRMTLVFELAQTRDRCQIPTRN